MSLAVARLHRRTGRRRAGHQPRDRSRFWIVVMCLAGLASVGAALAVAAAIWLIVWFGEFAGALPPPDQLTARAPFQTTPVYARDGSTLLYEITDPNGGRRTIVKLSQIPRYLIEATIATEDPSFFSNPGFEIRSILRAAVDDLTRGEIVSGASTITQQVARNVLLAPEERFDQSARRKIKEIILAYQLTQTYTKDDILSVYLNEINYGNRSYGVEAAAEGYFGKSVSQLDLAECALIAGLPQAPGYYDPYTRFDAVKRRQEYVLQRMVEQGYITPAQARAAAAEPLHFVDRPRAPLAPHFVNYVFDLLHARLGEERLYHGGYHVITTLDPPLQRIAERSVASNPSIANRSDGTNAALVALDPRSGQILAMVGSADYGDAAIAGEVNMALAPRPSAGILGPLTYALALENGDTLATRVNDVPPEAAGPSGSPDVIRAAHQYLGPVTLRQAIGLGLSAPALQILGHTGSVPFLDLLGKLGITDADRRVSYTPDLIVAGARVSPLEVAEAYAMLAAGGIAHPPTAIDRILDPNNRLVAAPRSDATTVLPAGVSYLVTSALADETVRPPDVQSALRLDRSVAVHAAVSEDQRDTWAAAYVPNLTVVVWVGSTAGRPVRDVDAPVEILGAFLRDAFAVRPPAAFSAPPEVVPLSLCANPACSVRRVELAIKGTEEAVQQANAAAIGNPSSGVSASQTPLVDRARLQPAPVPVDRPEPSGMITVPDLAGTSPEQARLRLGAIGLSSASVVKYVSGASLPPALRSIAVGQVVGTSPAAGERVAPGTAVILTVRRD